MDCVVKLWASRLRAGLFWLLLLAGLGVAAPGQAFGEAAEGEQTCLPKDLRTILARAHGKREVIAGGRNIALCAPSCLPRPKALSGDNASYYRRKHGIRWCKDCTSIGSYLPLRDILEIERAGSITLCPRLRGHNRIQRETSGEIIQSSALGLRGVLGSGDGGQAAHDNIAILIGNTEYRGSRPRKPSALADVAVVRALLAEKLGYRNANIIEIRDASLSDFVDWFGRRDAPDGLLRRRLKSSGRDETGRPPSVLIYISGFGAISVSEEEAYLLPVDFDAERDERSLYELEVFYENLAVLPARHVSVILEVDFSRDPAAIVLPPNVPLTPVATLPSERHRRLSVMTAAKSDQHTLEDPEYGCGLFTRFLVEGLSGPADVSPLGNGDGRIDSAEAFIFAAHKARIAAAKSFGILQLPRFSFSKPVVLGRVRVKAGK